MALVKSSERTSEGEWVDFKELAREGAAVVITVTKFEDSTDFGNGTVKPVRGRVIVLTGTKAGEVFEDERILAAGIRIKLTEVGDDVVGRIRPYGTRKHPGLENEEQGDIELAVAALDKANGTGNKRRSAKEMVSAASEEPPF